MPSRDWDKFRRQDRTHKLESRYHPPKVRGGLGVVKHGWWPGKYEGVQKPPLPGPRKPQC